MASVWAGSAAFVVVVLALGAAEKVVAAARGTARWHPISVARSLDHNASALFVAAAILDLAICAALLSGVARIAAGAAVILWMAFYSALLLTTPSVRTRATTCQCLISLFEGAGLPFVLIRNSVVAACGVTAVWRGPFAGASALVGAVLLFLLAVGARLSRATASHPLPASPTKPRETTQGVATW